MCVYLSLVAVAEPWPTVVVAVVGGRRRIVADRGRGRGSWPSPHRGRPRAMAVDCAIIYSCGVGMYCFGTRIYSCGTRLDSCGTRVYSCATRIYSCGTRICSCGTNTSYTLLVLNIRDIVLSRMRCFEGLLSSRRYRPDQEIEIYDVRIVPELQNKQET